MSDRDAFHSYRQRLDALGFRPSRARGQNFLLDPSLHRLIADTAAPTRDDIVLEVGTGLGFLTRELARRAGVVVGVEVDSRLLEVTRAELGGAADGDRVVLVGCDVLDGGAAGLHSDVAAAVSAAGQSASGDLLVVSNLPYAIAGPFLAEACAMERLPDRMVLLVQRELAERLLAVPATKAYGGLSVLVQSLFEGRRVREVTPQVFRPRPRVGSTILRLEKRAGGGGAAGWPASHRRAWRGFLRRLFAQRRKALRRTLPQALVAADPGSWAPELLARRAEALAVDELLDIWAACR